MDTNKVLEKMETAFPRGFAHMLQMHNWQQHNMENTIWLNVIVEGMKPMNRIILTCLFFAVFILERTVLFVSVERLKYQNSPPYKSVR